MRGGIGTIVPILWRSEECTPGTFRKSGKQRTYRLESDKECERARRKKENKRVSRDRFGRNECKSEEENEREENAGVERENGHEAGAERWGRSGIAS